MHTIKDFLCAWDDSHWLFLSIQLKRTKAESHATTTTGGFDEEGSDEDVVEDLILSSDEEEER